MEKHDGGPFMVGLDLGTTGAKAGIVGRSGQVLATAAVTYETATPRPGWAEQDPLDWWQASCAAVHGALDGGGISAGAIAGIGLSGQMHGSVFLDADESVIRPCILWCDQRTSDECDLITETVGAADLARWVGNPALPGFTAPKVLWLRANEPAGYARVRHLLLPKDYINLRLTGSLATEVSDASGTLLFDVTERGWSRRMLQKLEIPREWLPRVYESGEPIGELTKEAAAATGLRPGTPVAAGGADNACGALGMGVLSPGQVAVSIGSSGTVLAPTTTPFVDPGMRLHSFCHAVPGTWYLMGVMLSAGLALRWFRDELGEPENSEARERSVDPYELLSKTAAGAPAGCEGLVFLPYLTGERTPHADPCARGVLFGLDLTKTRAHVVRSIMEGVTFGLNDSISIMREMGVPLESVVSGGGGSRSPLWRQIQADTFELPITTAGTSDAAMLGAALLAGVAGGVFGSVEEACRDSVAHGERIEPDPSSSSAYRLSYARFRALYPAVKELFRK
jgi:xylulokinase